MMVDVPGGHQTFIWIQPALLYHQDLTQNNSGNMKDSERSSFKNRMASHKKKKTLSSETSLIAHTTVYYPHCQLAGSHRQTDTYTHGGIRFNHFGGGKVRNVLACCDMMMDGGEKKLGVLDKTAFGECYCNLGSDLVGERESGIKRERRRKGVMNQPVSLDLSFLLNQHFSQLCRPPHLSANIRRRS